MLHDGLFFKQALVHIGSHWLKAFRNLKQTLIKILGCWAISRPQTQQRLNKYFEVLLLKVFIAASLAIENGIVNLKNPLLVVPKRKKYPVYQ